MAICRFAESNPNTLVLGSRKLNADVPMRSKFGNTVKRFVCRVSTELNVYDTQTGLRAFRIDMIPMLLQIPGNCYEYEMNVLLHCARERIVIHEHTIETVYLDNNASSHFEAIKDSVRIYKEILKFSASSFVGFLIDYVVYSILLLFGCGLTFSNVTAIMISARVNFTLNRKLVFKSKKKLLRSIIKYVILAVYILAGNTLMLNLLVKTCGIHQMLAKIVTEIFFFVFSCLIQRLVVFRRRGDSR